jgi:hypothetical protein
MLVTASQEEFVTRLRNASGWHERNVVPDSLRAHGVDAVSLIVEADRRFRVVLNGLDNPYRPAMEIEGRGWLSADSVLHLEIGPTKSSVRGIAIVSAVLLALAGYNLLVLNPPNRLAYVLFIFVPSLLGWCWMQVADLTDRAWPGLLSFVKRVLVYPV